MATIRLLIDEDVRPLLAETLRQRGFDARHVDELKRSGLSDPEQLTFAVKQRRAIVTHNIRHYVLLDGEYRAQGQAHFGILAEAEGRWLRKLYRWPDASIVFSCILARVSASKGLQFLPNRLNA